MGQVKCDWKIAEGGANGLLAHPGGAATAISPVDHGVERGYRGRSIAAGSASAPWQHRLAGDCATALPLRAFGTRLTSADGSA